MGRFEYDVGDLELRFVQGGWIPKDYLVPCLRLD